jgi:nucleotide-binding universal stress UspA family protein
VTGPAVIGYDGSPAAKQAVKRSAAVLATTRALVVVVWEPGLAFELVQPDVLPAPIDIRAAMEVDRAMYDRARQLASEGATLAREVGFVDAEAIAVADQGTVAATLIRLVNERAGPAVVAGTHGHKGLRALLGSTTRDLIEHSPCPVLIARATTT